MRRRRSKAKTQRIHAARRCFQRYGFRLSKRQQDQIVHQIELGDAELVEHQTNRVSVFKANCEDQELYVVYDKKRKTLASVLSKDMVENDGRFSVPTEDDSATGVDCRLD